MSIKKSDRKIDSILSFSSKQSFHFFNIPKTNQLKIDISSQHLTCGMKHFRRLMFQQSWLKPVWDNVGGDSNHNPRKVHLYYEAHFSLSPSLYAQQVVSHSFTKLPLLLMNFHTLCQDVGYHILGTMKFLLHFPTS